MYNEFYLITLNKFLELTYPELIEKCLDSNPLISNIGIDALLKKGEDNLMVPDELLERIINKMRIEDIYNLVTSNGNSRLKELAYLKLKEILAYYDNNIELYQKIKADDEYFVKKKEQHS